MSNPETHTIAEDSHESAGNIQSEVSLNAFELSAELVKKTVETYMAYHNATDEAIRLGLFGEDLEEAIANPETISFSYATEDGQEFPMPLLVPAESLDWYDAEVLAQKYGGDKKFYCYIHPPLPADPKMVEGIKAQVRKTTDFGAIIITDQYVSRPESLAILELGDGYAIDTLGIDNKRNENNAFVGKVEFQGVTEIKSAPRLFDVYQQAVRNGQIEIDERKGLAMVDSFSDEEVETIWKMYDTQFAKLGANDPSPAGFDKTGLKELMQNPNVAKIVFREDGDVVSLCFFNHDFAISPWFNKTYYERVFPDYARTDNVVMFPGIVSDESKKGSNYSRSVVDFAMMLYRKRGSNAMMTFECTQTSTEYIPRIVTWVINGGDHGTVAGLESPISTTIYRALKKS